MRWSFLALPTPNTLFDWKLVLDADSDNNSSGTHLSQKAAASLGGAACQHDRCIKSEHAMTMPSNSEVQPYKHMLLLFLPWATEEMAK